MIFRSLFVIAAVAAVAGAGTYAWFTSQATITGSTFSTGTMNLKVDANSDPAGVNWVKSFAAPGGYLAKLYPGFSDNQIIDIYNQGDVDGVATIKFDVVDGTWSALGDNLNFTVYYDGTDTSTFGDAIASGSLAAWNHNTYTLGNLDKGKIGQVKIVWSVPTSAGNDIQGKSVAVDTTFGLEQAQ